MQRFPSRAPAMHGTKRHDHRETIERSEINSGGLLTQDTRSRTLIQPVQVDEFDIVAGCGEMPEASVEPHEPKQQISQRS